MLCRDTNCSGLCDFLTPDGVGGAVSVPRRLRVPSDCLKAVRPPIFTVDSEASTLVCHRNVTTQSQSSTE